MQLAITSDDLNLRIDKFLRARLVNAPLSVIFKFLRSKVKINGKKVEPSYRIKENDSIELLISEQEFENLSKTKNKTPQRQTFSVLHEDDDLLVIDKPSGLASHSGTGVMENNLMDQIFSYLGRKNVALVNRLDRETSGIVVVGKNKQVVRALNQMIKERKVKKYYLALVKGEFKRKSGTLKSYVKRIEEDFQHRTIISAESEPDSTLAELNYNVISSAKDFTLLEIELITGKMHQIRAQLQSEHHPIIGDKLYGDEEINKKLKLNRQFLHAYKIIFRHPTTSNEIIIESPLPESLKKVKTSIFN